MKLNNKGYLIVEIIVASAIAMGLAYFLLELVVDLKNKNEDYYVNTLLETDKALMTREVMNDVSNYKIKSITSDNENYVEFVYINGDDEFTKRITIDKENKTFKYGLYNSSYVIDENYFEKSFASELTVKGITIENKCYYNDKYVICDSLSSDELKNVVDGLVTISVDAVTMYSDYNYGLELNIKYKKTATIIYESDDLIINNSNMNMFNNKGDYSVNVDCTNAKARWNYIDWKLDVYSIKATDTCNVLISNRKDNLAQFVINNSNTVQGDGRIVNENGYRYEGKDPNNYVLFNDELWRIIGVFDEETHGVTGQYLTKIIREVSIGNYAWDKNGINDWSRASLNTILNKYYYNKENGTGQDACYFYSNIIPGDCDFRYIGLNATSRNMIQNVTWFLGGYNGTSYTATQFYETERSSNVFSGRPTKWTGNVGLMYPSDFGYSVLYNFCNRDYSYIGIYNNKNCAGKLWLLKESSEWTITSVSTSSEHTFDIYDYLSFAFSYYSKSVRPTVYLKNSIYIIAGDGSITNPYVLGI